MGFLVWPGDPNTQYVSGGGHVSGMRRTMDIEILGPLHASSAVIKAPISAASPTPVSSFFCTAHFQRRHWVEICVSFFHTAWHFASFRYIFWLLALASSMFIVILKTTRFWRSTSLFLWSKKSKSRWQTSLLSRKSWNVSSFLCRALTSCYVDHHSSLFLLLLPFLNMS